MLVEADVHVEGLVCLDLSIEILKHSRRNHWQDNHLSFDLGVAEVRDIRRTVGILFTCLLAFVLLVGQLSLHSLVSAHGFLLCGSEETVCLQLALRKGLCQLSNLPEGDLEILLDNQS